ncbi:hypothetical protein [Rubellicoccus peritrichatus]|uniref:Uncharacterized protein n=1 Tax=Rubellicoccus peritrichatus TaxID=3080537 RepID=A0AAQ3QVW5_9BACT|nr:hypothetical protein [Puniceicoccus sp. CR14]WOO41325.1 hypothetical protein RZN69_22120 [Puniceicoccus sp. CR14]
MKHKIVALIFASLFGLGVTLAHAGESDGSCDKGKCGDKTEACTPVE